MGCGCGGKSRIATSTNAVKRVTVFQVLSTTNTVVEEHSSLSEARAKATEVGGRVKVTSKIV